MEGENGEEEREPARYGWRGRPRRLHAGDRQRILPLEGRQRGLRARQVGFVHHQRPAVFAGAAQLVRDALFVQDEREVHGAPEIIDQPQEHAGSLHGAVL